MRSVSFFKNKSFLIKNLFQDLKSQKNIKINNIKTLKKAKKFDLTFFDSIKYKSYALVTEGSYCITTQKLEK